MKTGLVLAGGGTRGSYQNGAIRALHEIGEDHWDLVTGTSIGALCAALIVQKDEVAMEDMWRNLTQDQIIKGEFVDRFDLGSMINGGNRLASFFKSYIHEKGADISPFREKVHTMYKPEEFMNSDIDFGCVTVKVPTMEPVFVTKDMMKENGEDWLIASASAFPAFPIQHIDGKGYIDGGYYDNLPIDLAIKMGAKKLIVIDLRHEPHHPSMIDRDGIVYIFPQFQTGSFLEFNRDVLDRLDILGYNDAMKAYRKYGGVRYTFKKPHPPKYCIDLAREIMNLDTRIKEATEVNGYLFSESYIEDQLKARQHVQLLSDRRVFYGLLDVLMEMLEFEETEVYDYVEVRNRILASFAKCAEENFAWQMPLNPSSVMNILPNGKQRDRLERLVHAELYPNHKFFPDKLVLTLYPMEKALAILIRYMMMELKDE